MKRYVGIPEERTKTGGRRVDVEDETGAATPLNPRNDLCNHSPNGFEWGYEGSGPAQLALAILADHLEGRSELLGVPRPTKEDSKAFAGRLALRLHQSFKHQVIAHLEQGELFVLHESDVATYVQTALLVERTAPGGGERDE
jgi:hypothetical protein